MKVAVEDSFRSESFVLDKDGKGNSSGDPPSSSTSAMENWTIKLEQSINFFLTVYNDFPPYSLATMSTITGLISKPCIPVSHL